MALHYPFFRSILTFLQRCLGTELCLILFPNSAEGAGDSRLLAELMGGHTQTAICLFNLPVVFGVDLAPSFPLRCR